MGHGGCPEHDVVVGEYVAEELGEVGAGVDVDGFAAFAVDEGAVEVQDDEEFGAVGIWR